jgi:ribosomal protein S18 acetylase RimI-like enzyme
MFKKKSVEIKSAGPDYARQAAEFIFETDPHVFAFWFGGAKERAVEYFAFQWRSKEGPFSHIFASGAFDGEDLVGIEAGYDRDRQHREGRAFFRHAEELLTPSEYDRFKKAIGYMPFLNPPIPRDAYYLQTLAVSMRRQREGIGELLIASAFDRAAAHEYRSCHLDVYADNPAVDFYLRMGMEIFSETRVPCLEEHHHIARHYRMVKIF